MSGNVIALIPQIELDLIEEYLNGRDAYGSEFREYFRENDIAEDAQVGALEIAVARIILNPIQSTLPQWAGVRGDGHLALNRKPIKRHPKATALTLNPRLICCVNWADSAPGFSWPESYHVTYIPGFEKFIVTSSRDGAEPFGSADHALGWGHAAEGELLVAKRLMQKFWQGHVYDWDQGRWIYLFDEGLIDRATADAWADEIWPPEVEEDEGEDD